jgi:hypothetical protein
MAAAPATARYRARPTEQREAVGDWRPASPVAGHVAHGGVDPCTALLDRLDLEAPTSGAGREQRRR